MIEQELRLNTGRTLPSVGFGTWKVDSEIVPSMVSEAARCGYRHFDCACDYGNEQAVGAGLQEVMDSGICRREDLKIASKLWNTYHRPEHVRSAVERSLRDLRLEYLDLYLIHFPIAMKFVPFEDRYPPGWFIDPAATSPRMELDPVPISETWRAMEELVAAELVRDIGVCNFGCSLLRDLMSYAQIRPAVLQVELHPHLVQQRLVRFCREEGIAVTAFSPLGGLSYVSLGMADESESVLEDEIVRSIAQKHEKTPAQIVLRWGVQRGTAVIPKTSRPERLKENFDIFGFQLTEDQMYAITGLNRNRRFNDLGNFCEAAFNTFCPIFD